MKKVKKDNEDFEKQIPYFAIKFTREALKVAGYKFVAIIEHQGGGNIIRTIPGKKSTQK